jgi:hypothetical protein
LVFFVFAGPPLAGDGFACAGAALPGRRTPPPRIPFPASDGRDAFGGSDERTWNSLTRSSICSALSP